MYIVIMKTRTEEYKVVKEMNRYFGNHVFPLFEILKDEYTPRYKMDLDTGRVMYEIKEGKTRRSKIQLPEREEDRTTLQDIERLLSGKIAFIDFHRFGSKKNRGRLNETYTRLPLELAADYEIYAKRLLEVTQYQNLIPVVSIMGKPDDVRIDVIKLVQRLKESGHPIAVRISIVKFEEYGKRLAEYLQDTDFLMIDIGRQKINSLDPAFTMIRHSDIRGKRILLNSPRDNNLNNGDYEENAYTDLIDCSACSDYSKMGFSGFGDYGGLKDLLPENTGGGGNGSALALLYDRYVNKFFSIMNQDSTIGTKGYRDVLARIMQRKVEFDPENDCPAIRKVENLWVTGKTGGWATWIWVTLSRYIHQQYKRYN